MWTLCNNWKLMKHIHICQQKRENKNSKWHLLGSFLVVEWEVENEYATLAVNRERDGSICSTNSVALKQAANSSAKLIKRFMNFVYLYDRWDPNNSYNSTYIEEKWLIFHEYDREKFGVRFGLKMSKDWTEFPDFLAQKNHTKFFHLFSIRKTELYTDFDFYFHWPIRIAKKRPFHSLKILVHFAVVQSIKRFLFFIWKKNIFS